MSKVNRRRSALGFGATVREAIRTIASSPAQASFNVAGTLVGAAAAIVAIGVSTTSQSQVDSVFDGYAQTQVTVVTDDANGFSLPASEARLEQLPGVVAATTVSRLQQTATLESGALGDIAQAEFTAPIFAVGPSAEGALELGDWTGRPLDTGDHVREDAVAVVGLGIASDLGLVPPYVGSSLEINGEQVTVVGVFAYSPRERQLTQAVLVPRSWSDKLLLDVTSQKLVVRVDIGAADVIANRVPVEVDPFEPDRILVSAPATAEALRAQVASQVGLLALLMAGGALFVGSIGISNTALIAVLRRTGELSLRRALGATPHDVARLVVLEGGILGLVSGFLGAIVGTLIVIGVSWVADWTPLLAVRWVIFVGVGAAILGALFSVYPAHRASLIEPAAGLREL